MSTDRTTTPLELELPVASEVLLHPEAKDLPIVPTPTEMPLNSSVSSQARPRIHLDFLDGLRAIAALYVVMEHCSINVQFNMLGSLELTGWMFRMQELLWLLVFRFGHYSVDVFIVLSGFCLMMPTARIGNDALPQGVWGFIKRRATRILPPYYAAVALSLLASAGLGIARYAPTPYWNQTLPAFEPWPLLSHLFLFHNWTPYIFRINTPFWSIAVEWQIYFLFPILLLLKKKCGPWAAFVCVAILGFLPHFVIGAWTDQTYPWYVLLFFFGMVAADLSFGRLGDETKTKLQRFPFYTAFVGLTIAICVLSLLQFKRFNQGNWKFLHTYFLNHEWNLDIVIGIATAFLLIDCVRRLQNNSAPSAVLRLLSRPLLVKIGGFSYSLYLTHSVIILLVDILAVNLKVPAAGYLILMYIVTLPISVLAAYPFYLVFERPFMVWGKRLSASPATPVPPRPSEGMA